MASPMYRVNEVVSSKIGDYLTNKKTWGNVMYNVLEHGLVGDGITNDTAALQTLINLAISEGRKAIFFPHTPTGGEYFVSSLINADQVVFFGDNASFVGGYGGIINQLGDSGDSSLGLGINVKEYGAVGDGVSDDTAAINNAIAALPSNGVLIFPSDSTYRITSKINLPIGGKSVFAYSATFLLDYDGVLFDLNPSADPNNIEGTSQSYGFWYGGIFTSTLANPTNAVALRFYGIRQMTIRDIRVGTYGTTQFNAGLEFSGLGGHLIDKVRFVYVKRCVYVPDWGNDGASSPVTTSTFNNLDFILGENQYGFYVVGGWNRWRIFGGFSNAPAGSTIMYFSNHYEGDTSCTNLLIQGVGCEQPGVGSKFIHFDDTSSTLMSNITIQNCTFQGDTASGGVVAVALERCRYVQFTGNRFEQTTAAGNTSISIGANCQDIAIDRTNSFSGSSISSAVNRTEITFDPTMRRYSYLALTGYEGAPFSSSSVTLDMSDLLGSNFPVQLPPIGYFLEIQARDSGSSTSTTAGLEVMQEASTAAPRRLILDLSGVANDKRISAQGYVPADANGDIALQLYASGTGTLDVWIYVVCIHQ